MDLKKIEQEVLALLIERLANIGKVNADDLEKLMDLQNSGEDLSLIKAKIKEIILQSKPEIFKEVEEFAKDYYNKATEKLNENFEDFDKNFDVQKIVSTKKSEIFEDFTELFDENNLGFIDDDNKFKPLEKYYREAVNTAIKTVINEPQEYEEFLQSTVETLANKGLVTQIVPQSGIIDNAYEKNIDSNFNSNLDYNLQVLSDEIRENLADESKATGYEIDWHPGHRPSHWFGGQQFTFEEMESKGINKLLKDYNCRHEIFPVIVGVTPPRFSQETIRSLEDREKLKYDFNGRKYTLYELTQKKNEYERKIKKQERLTKVLSITGDTAEKKKAENLLTNTINAFKILKNLIGDLFAGEFKDKKEPYEENSMNMDKSVQLKPLNPLGEQESEEQQKDTTTEKINEDIQNVKDKVNSRNNIEQFKKEFIIKMYETARELQEITGVPASIIVAQAAIESEYGNRTPHDKYTGKDSNNIFGIKAYGDTEYVRSDTREVINGKSVTIEANFAAYENITGSLLAHNELLSNKYADYITTGTLEDWAWVLQNNGYATDPNYAETILAVIKYWGLI